VDGMVTICWVYIERMVYLRLFFSCMWCCMCQSSPAPVISATCRKRNQARGKKISIHLHTPPQGIKQFEYPSSFSLLIQSIQKHKVIRPCRTKPPRCTSMHPSPTPEKRFPQTPIDDMGTQRLYKRVRYVNNVMWVGANVDVCGGRGVRD
jgi:hypothetical protein